MCSPWKILWITTLFCSYMLQLLFIFLNTFFWHFGFITWFCVTGCDDIPNWHFSWQICRLYIYVPLKQLLCNSFIKQFIRYITRVKKKCVSDLKGTLHLPFQNLNHFISHFSWDMKQMVWRYTKTKMRYFLHQIQHSCLQMQQPTQMTTTGGSRLLVWYAWENVLQVHTVELKSI